MAKKKVQVGQGNLLTGAIEGLDELVNKPEVLEHDGLRVVQLIISEEDVNVPKYVETALGIARAFAPDIKSQERPPWLRADWQVKRRKRKAGLK